MRPLRAVLAVLLLVTSLAVAHAYSGGDTGTYRILGYRVVMEPLSDGRVKLAIHQTWRVTGGHIPWITIGLPNEHYEINGYSGAVRSVNRQDSDDWYGVQVDLDRDYQPGETFKICVNVTASHLFYREDEWCTLDYAPGWYDRAVIDVLRVDLKPPVDAPSLKCQPVCDSSDADGLHWVREGLSPGDMLRINVYFRESLLPSPYARANLGQSPKQEQHTGIVIAAVAGLVILTFIIWVGATPNRGYSGGRFGRGGGSCACACAGCACACACAGGGGAGCDRKLRHTCRACRYVDLGEQA